MEFGELKPYLKALALPPASLLLVLLAAQLLALRRRRLGAVLGMSALLLLWLLGCNAVAYWLEPRLLSEYPTLTLAALKERQVQAIVVVGGGLTGPAPEYGGEPQLGQYTAPRVRYGAWLARHSGLPLAYSGGLAWGYDPATHKTEGEVAQRLLLEDYGLRLRWVDSKSRDTEQNGRLMGELLRRDGIRRIALVTHAFHMPRTMHAFAASGLELTPAPLGRFGSEPPRALDWLPSVSGFTNTYLVLHEWLGLRVARLGSTH